MYLSWENAYNFYKYYCKSNKDYLKKFDIIPLADYDSNIIQSRNKILNKDMIESINQTEELTELYKYNTLVTTRLGCVESSFIIKYIFDFNLPSHLLRKKDIDKNMRTNAGFYYKDKDFKKEICDWWCKETIELIHRSTLTSCYCFLNFDLTLWSLLDIRKKFYNYCNVHKIILQNSEGKKILYIGNGIESIKKGFELGLQNMWKFKVSNFSMYYLKTPQTTEGCEYPHKSIRDTCEFLVEEILEKYNDFDTAILGCGAYGPPIINILRKKFKKKNLVYLGSDCYKMFGVYSHLMPNTQEHEAIKENWIEVVDILPEGCKNHPEPKYWKKAEKQTINEDNMDEYTEDNFSKENTEEEIEEDKSEEEIEEQEIKSIKNIYFIDNFSRLYHTDYIDKGFGASEQQFYNLINYLSNQRKNYTFYCFNKGEDKKIKNVKYINISKIKEYEISKDSILIIQRFYPYHLKDYIKNCISYVWIHDLFWSHMYTGNIKDQISWNENKNELIDYFTKNNINFICNSLFCKNEMIKSNKKLGIEILNSKIKIIYNNLYKSSNIDKIKDSGLNTDVNKIIFASAYQSKGGKEIVNIFNELIRKNKNLKLYLYSPSYNNIDLEPSDNIIIKNTICKEELYKEIKSSLCVLTPITTKETFGCIFAESLYLNTPILVDKNSGAVEELITNKDEILDFNEIDNLLNRITLLQNNIRFIKNNVILNEKYIDKPLEEWLSLIDYDTESNTTNHLISESLELAGE